VLALGAGCAPAAPPDGEAGAWRDSAADAVSPLERPVVDAETAGSVRGIVVLDGPAPTPDDALLVSDGRVGGVVVHVAAGLEGLRFDPPAVPADIVLREDRLLPRVTAVMTEQSVRVRGEDELPHHLRARCERNAERDAPLPAGAGELSFGFRRPELPVRLGCDLHPSTVGVVAVLADPCFAVTAADGSYEIGGLPPGHYTLEAWHETLGRRTLEVDVRPAERTDAPVVVFKLP